jgi:hypothetical protein
MKKLLLLATIVFFLLSCKDLKTSSRSNYNPCKDYKSNSNNQNGDNESYYSAVEEEG